jgi:hypothetical protein
MTEETMRFGETIQWETMRVGETIQCEDGRVLEIKNSGDSKYPFSLVDQKTGKEIHRLSYLVSREDMEYLFAVDWEKHYKEPV